MSHAHKIALSLESLESRNLQSALTVGSTPIAPVAAPSAIITSFQAPGVSANHGYQIVAGFYGQ